MGASEKVPLSLRVNGVQYTLRVDPAAMLVDVLREDLGLTGTKIGCREGECGACTIIMDGKAICSCLLPALKATNRGVRTIEGLGTLENPHPLQLAFAEEGAVQCGYCTPGFIMSALALLESTPTAKRADILDALSGNLCRCTGYVRIVRAIERVIDEMRSARSSR